MATRRMRWAAGDGEDKEAVDNGDGKEDKARQLSGPWKTTRRIPCWGWQQNQQELWQQEQWQQELQQQGAQQQEATEVGGCSSKSCRTRSLQQQESQQRSSRSLGSCRSDMRSLLVRLRAPYLLEHM